MSRHSSQSAWKSRITNANVLAGGVEFRKFTICLAPWAYLFDECVVQHSRRGVVTLAQFIDVVTTI